jgi:hypothetical protein
MSKSNIGWRLLAEVNQPPESHDNEWMLAGLAAALASIRLPPQELQRVVNATVEAVTLARRQATRLHRAPRMMVRVLVSAPVEVGTAPSGWSFYVIERAAGELNDTEADGDRADTRPWAQVIELCIYADGSSA